jgi:protein O-mannosyl-transferase
MASSLGLTVLCYASAFSNELLYDDVPLIETNAFLRTTHGLWIFFTRASITSSPIWPHHYRPILMLTFWLNYWLGGVDPVGYRVTNLAVHMVNGWLAFCLLRRVLRRWVPAPDSDWASAFGASIFLLHPIQSIALNLVLKRNSSLCALFMLAALLLNARAHEATRRRRLGYAAALGCGVLAMLTKEDAIALPALVALLALATGAGGVRQALPFVVAPAVFIARIAPQETILGAHSMAIGHLLAQPIAFFRYARMLVQPDAIAIAYDLEPVMHPLPWLRLVALVALAATVSGLWIGRGRWPLAALAGAWAALVLFPTSSIFPIFLTMDEVRCYLAFLFVYGLVGVGLARLTAWLRQRAVALRTASFVALSPWLILCVSMVASDWRIDRAWSDALGQNAHAVERYPSSQLGNRGLCEQIFVSSSREAAVTQCSRAVELWPSDPTSRYYLVGSLAQAGRFDAAARAARAAVRQFPESDVAWAALGHLAWLRDDNVTAAAAYRRVLAVSPLDDGVRAHLADVLLAEGDRHGARQLIESFDGAPPGRAIDAQLLQSVGARLAGSNGR